MIDLTSARIVITGGSAGLGLEMVKSLVQCGAEVTAIARDDIKLAAARESGAQTIAGDATDAALIRSAVTDIDPDVLILNAGSKLRTTTIDQQDWEGFSGIWNTDVKATFVGIQAALNNPMRPGTRVLVTSSGAAMVMSHPNIKPYDLRMSSGYVGAKRMVWFMAHQANAVSRDRGLNINFQVLVPGQLVGATALGHAVATACAAADGVTIEEHILHRYGSHLQAAQIGRQVAELLTDPRYEQGVAFGFRDNVDIIPFDQ
jgi:NAD(P)-dependent dehydrogenase (short-subunit alcohol dehydrogenase family)